jgi:hypothetical protein
LFGVFLSDDSLDEIPHAVMDVAYASDLIRVVLLLLMKGVDLSQQAFLQRE